MSIVTFVGKSFFFLIAILMLSKLTFILSIIYKLKYNYMKSNLNLLDSTYVVKGIEFVY